MFQKRITITVLAALFVIITFVTTVHSFGVPDDKVSRATQDKWSQPSSITCTVTTTRDSGPGSLRQCLLNTVQDTMINFDPQMFSPITPMTITLSLSLPRLTTDSVTIDGSNAGVILDGSQLSKGTGLVIDGSNGVVIQGLQVTNFPDNGIAIIGGARNTVIGGDRSIGTALLGQGNLISHNGGSGVWLEEVETSDNVILGNYIGTDARGMIELGNGLAGVTITGGSKNNVIGGKTAETHNLISGNKEHGIVIEGEGTTGNQVRGNYIGADAMGTSAIKNGHDGIAIRDHATMNIVGGETDADRNVISGNGHFGIYIKGAHNNHVRGNYIGTDITGTKALGNLWDGLAIVEGAQANIVGSDTIGMSNIVSGNNHHGILIANEGTDTNKVLGNYIGIDMTGAITLSNGWDGIVITDSAQANFVGGYTTTARNIISGNNFGIFIAGKGTTNNHISGNYIGTNATGISALGNKWAGVTVKNGAQNNIIGGNKTGARNLISGNGHEGIVLQGEGTSGNQVSGNYIGIEVTGAITLTNGWDGVVIKDGAQDNVIGGEIEEARNIISGNNFGVLIEGNQTTGNQIRGNYIGTDATGSHALGNNWEGIVIEDGTQGNVVGGDTEEARNIISGNTLSGIMIRGDGTTNNQVLGNYIGTDPTGLSKLTNNWNGIEISGGAKNNLVGGDSESARNVISGNGLAGIVIQGEGTTDNQLCGNFIGTDAYGIQPLGNSFGVVIIAKANHNTIAGNLISGNEFIGTAISEGAFNSEQPSMLFGDLKNKFNDLQLSSYPKEPIRAIYESKSAHVMKANPVELGSYKCLPNSYAKSALGERRGPNNEIFSNYIGTDISGQHAIPNELVGLLIYGSSNNMIGGEAPGLGNLISGNGEGLIIAPQTPGDNSSDENPADENQVLGNYIGTDVTGTKVLTDSFQQNGVQIVDTVLPRNMRTFNGIMSLGAKNNVIGGHSEGARNLISGHIGYGIFINGIGINDNKVCGNYIGTDVTGTHPLSNALGGVRISGGASNNIVGGGKFCHGNLISGNKKAGVQLHDTTNNRLADNYIGTNAQGTASVENSTYGIQLTDGANANLIGNSNTIAYNRLSGVYIGGGASENVIGIDNTIAYNGSVGVVVDGETTRGNQITRTAIHNNSDAQIEFINVFAPPPPPKLNSYSPSNQFLLGKTCSHCRVEVFGNPNQERAGSLFLDEVMADATGAFTITLDIPTNFPHLSATVRDKYGTTSGFSASLSTVPETPTVTPTHIPTNTPVPTPTNTPVVHDHLYLPLVLR